MARESLLDIEFEAEIIHWRGPAPFFFAPLPADLTDAVRAAARSASYGWGVVPVTARVGETDFTTSLFPRDGGYLLPIKASVRRDTGTNLGDRAAIALRIARPLGDL